MNVSFPFLICNKSIEETSLKLTTITFWTDYVYIFLHGYMGQTIIGIFAWAEPMNKDNTIMDSLI